MVTLYSFARYVSDSVLPALYFSTWLAPAKPVGAGFLVSLCATAVPKNKILKKQ
jgi:hypothetical protein